MPGLCGDDNGSSKSGVQGYTHHMAGSFKDALEKWGIVEKKPEAPRQDPKKWKHEISESDHRPFIPFEAPARTKPREPTKEPKR